MAENIKPPSITDIAKLGTLKKEFPVGLTAHFLEQFSEQLYSSPNKAFEELLANSWDANARSAYLFLPLDPTASDAAIFVLDDGDSMDGDGLQDLWKIAFSKKKQHETTTSGRAMIGKFGIGKLATYVLAHELTYVCKAADGIIRAVTMDYRNLDAGNEQLLTDLRLGLREVNASELQQILGVTTDGKAIYELIKRNIPPPKASTEWDDEFAAPRASQPTSTGTWTLVVLSSLKAQGQEIKRGIVRRMIQAALPLGAELNIVLNSEHLVSTKSKVTTITDWVIGPSLGISEIELQPQDGAGESEDAEKITILSSNKPYPHVEIVGLGKITGRVKLFHEKISGGKSEEHGPSNGFFVNVRGRVTNSDPQFGEKDLSHSAWSRFRMTVRVDGLNNLLAVNREQFADRRELRIFKAFLRACFNKMRIEWEKQDKWADSGAAIIDNYGMLPLLSLRDYLEDLMSDPGSANSNLVDLTGIQDVSAGLSEFQQATKNDVREVLKDVEFESLGEQAPAVRYSLKTRNVIVNRDHPYVKEHSGDKAEKEVLKDSLLIDLLTEGYANEIGIDIGKIEELREKRDRISRLLTKIHRRSGAQIASLLLEVSKHPDFRPLEIIVGDALDFLGFDVTPIAGSGEPEGVAKAKLLAAKDGTLQSYSFSYDAKSSTHGKAQTGNCNVAGLARHREDKGVDYILLVGPNFQSGALEQECAANAVTPIRAADLGKLLVLSAEYGAISLTKLREMFSFTDPNLVAAWVNDLETWLKAKRTLTIADFVQTLGTLEETFPDIISVTVLADHARQVTGNQSITANDVRNLVAGLQILVPDLAQIDKDSVVINAHPNKLGDAIGAQLEKFRKLTSANATSGSN